MSRDLDETHTTGEMKLPDSTREPDSPVLVQLAGPGAVRRFDLDREVTTIDRDAEANDILLEDPWVSRTHTQLVLEGGRARLEDQGSRNGCSVNSRAVRDTELEDGDLIQIGQTTFKYLRPGSAEAPFYSEVFRLAFHDPVTGTYSRRYFDEALEREILRVDRRRRLPTRPPDDSRATADRRRRCPLQSQTRGPQSGGDPHRPGEPGPGARGRIRRTSDAAPGATADPVRSKRRVVFDLVGV